MSIYLGDRVKTLARISGLLVRAWRDPHKNNHNVFEFFRGDHVIKTVYTYPKAKVFAEGVAFGRREGS